MEGTTTALQIAKTQIKGTHIFDSGDGNMSRIDVVTTVDTEKMAFKTTISMSEKELGFDDMEYDDFTHMLEPIMILVHESVTAAKKLITKITVDGAQLNLFLDNQTN